MLKDNFFETPSRGAPGLPATSVAAAQHLLKLQQLVGNRTVTRMFTSTMVREPLIQRGTILGHADITDAVETTAKTLNAEDALRYAVASCPDPKIVNAVFETLSRRAIENLPENAPNDLWIRLARTRDALGQASFDMWLAKAKLKVLDIPELRMLLTDRSTRGAQEQAEAVLHGVVPLARFTDKSYDFIVGHLKSRGFIRQEKYNAVGDDNVPYGQDVWTSDEQLVC